MRKARFYLKTLMGQFSDRTGTRVSYRVLSNATGISTSTLSHLATNKQTLISLSVLERLCDFFGCELHDLVRLEPQADSDSG